MPMLLAVPNISEGRDDTTIDAIAAAFASGGAAGPAARAGAGDHPPAARLLDIHRDPDHNRSVFTLAGEPGTLAPALLAGATEALRRIDIRDHDGLHPHVGVLDVAPIVYLDEADRGAASAEALVVADLLARHLELPVLLYGELAQGRSRAELRRGGPDELARRLAAGELKTDFGPPEPHPRGGTTLVAARPPLVAFNVVLEPPATLTRAREIAGAIREGGAEGLPGVRAIGLHLLRQDRIQISMNVEQPDAPPLRDVIAAIRRHAPIASAELVALAPAEALEGLPADLPIPGFDPDRHVIERALRAGA